MRAAIIDDFAPCRREVRDYLCRYMDEHYAVDSYEVRACGYLVKPYEYRDFKKTMELCGMEKIRGARFICVEQEKILLREILWCDQNGHYTQIHTEERGALRFRIPFGNLAEMLSAYPQFLPCYKCCIVNMERAACIDKLDFLMDTGAKIPFSGRRRSKIEKRYYSYLFQREREGELV